jgi:calcineurin-like phosphoesterase family protein
MDATILANYRKVDLAGHFIVVAGDVAFNLKAVVALYGNIFAHNNKHTVVIGNHDRADKDSQVDFYMSQFGGVYGTSKRWRTNFTVIEDEIVSALGNKYVNVLVSHLPQPQEVLEDHGCAYNVYGHVHNGFEIEPEQHNQEYIDWLWTSSTHLNACVELHDYRPVPLKELIAYQEARRQTVPPRGKPASQGL